MNLAEQETGTCVVVIKVKGHGAFRRRIVEMGFVKGKVVRVIKNAPLKDPIEYEIMGYKVSLRRSESSLIEVEPLEGNEVESYEYEGIVEDGARIPQWERSRKTIQVALVGNPNSGKTTLFNQASGAREHVGNYSGVTVDSKQGSFKHKGYTIVFTDLPGTYSLTAYSPEELFVRRHLREEVPDIVLNVLVASNLERNLYITTQLIDMDLRVVVALNMYDELEKQGGKLDYVKLGKMLGIPFCPTVGSKGEGMEALFDELIDVYEERDPIVRHIHINYGSEVEQAIKAIQTIILKGTEYKNKMSPRYISLKLLEQDAEVIQLFESSPIGAELKTCVKEQVQRIAHLREEDPETVIVNAKYGFISGALKETFIESKQTEIKTTEIIDTIVTHKLWGYPLFLIMMWCMFQFTFTLGQYPQDWIQWGVDCFGAWIGTTMQAGPLKDLIVDGIIGGVGSVIVFLPNIMILYAFISFFEDSGYMARAAFIMDKLMHKMGLHGKSFIPLLMGFGCNVPAILSTRTIENRSNRLLTMLINPLMSCSARLVVYLLFVKAFFPENASYVLIGLYATGIVLSIGIARLFKRTLFKTEESPFVMELPPYRMPTLRSITKHTWSKGVQYLKKMGGIILIASIVVWFLGYFPQQSKDSKQYATELEKNSAHEKGSYIGQIGQFIEPALKPLGMNWKVGVSLLSGVVAKEIVISTMGVIYKSEDVNAASTDQEKKALEKQLIERIRADTWTEGKRKGQVVFTPLVALCFLLFVLLYFPCLAVVVAIKNNSGSWKWAALTVVYTTSLAWIVSFVVFQVGTLMGF